ncbi:MAG TPA: metallophosphoesterase [Spirochaetia bacterium]|nr:metallophosphoesterase [Spirochaetia bacterium]
MSQPSPDEELECLYARTPAHPLSERDRYIIFSDLHLGNGGRNDDFKSNSQLFLTLLDRYYWPRGDTLILNGDIEELERFNVEPIVQRWTPLYSILERFANAGRLYKIFGNHDYELSVRPTMIHPFRAMEAMRLSHPDGDMFIFHGHQTGRRREQPNLWVRYILRYLANPLGINNTSASHDSRKRYLTEQRISDFSRKRKLISIIGHTHRPLFESLSKVDVLKYTIENLVRDYVSAEERTRREIEAAIRDYRQELDAVTRKDLRRGLRETLYASNVVIPVLFNSGCVIGKRGVTGIELSGSTIALVHWFDTKVSRKYLNYHGRPAEELAGTDYYRKVLNEDYLSYVFSRIKLLA